MGVATPLKVIACWADPGTLTISEMDQQTLFSSTTLITEVAIQALNSNSRRTILLYKYKYVFRLGRRIETKPPLGNSMVNALSAEC